MVKSDGVAPGFFGQVSTGYTATLFKNLRQTEVAGIRIGKTWRSRDGPLGSRFYRFVLWHTFVSQSLP